MVGDIFSKGDLKMYKNLCEKPIAQWQKETADRWYQEDAYKKIVDSREGCPDFVWVEGPPTANGHPRIHHVMARSLDRDRKSVV